MEYDFDIGWNIYLLNIVWGMSLNALRPVNWKRYIIFFYKVKVTLGITKWGNFCKLFGG